MKKHEFPIAKVREDGTPAIWLTHTHWLLLEPGIVRAYLENREHFGHRRARRQYREETGRTDHPRIKEWQFLDSWPQDSSHAESAFALFQAGFDAWRHVSERNAQRVGPHYWTPDKLKAAGDRAEQRGFDEEQKLLRPTEEVAP